MLENSLVIVVNSTWMNTCLGIMKNEPEVVHWIKQKGIDTNPLDLFQFTACSLSISTEYGRPQKPYWESITLIKKSLHRLAPFFSVTKVDAINICWLCVVKGDPFFVCFMTWRRKYCLFTAIWRIIQGVKFPMATHWRITRQIIVALLSRQKPLFHYPTTTTTTQRQTLSQCF